MLLNKYSLLLKFVISICLVFGMLVIGSTESEYSISASSSSAMKWVTRPSAGNGNWQGVTWSPELGRVVSVSPTSAFPAAVSQKVMTSDNATTWSMVANANQPTQSTVQDVAWSSELEIFVSVSCNRGASACTANPGQRVATSTDGLVWTAQTSADDTAQWRAITWSPELGLFAAVSRAGTQRIMTSPNGINWTARTAPSADAWEDIEWSPALGIFVAVASTGTDRVMTSSDGTNWTAHSAAENNYWTDVAWSPELGMFVAVSSDGTNRVMTSSDGENWTARSAAETNAWNSVVWSANFEMFVAVSAGGTSRIMTSANGEDWVSVAAPATGVDWNDIIYIPDGDYFLAVGTGGAANARVMTGNLTTIDIAPSSNPTATTVQLSGNYIDQFPNANSFFRYRIAGSGDPYTESDPVLLGSAGVFSDTITGLTPETTYEFVPVIQWEGASGTDELVAGSQTFTTAAAFSVSTISVDDNSATSVIAQGELISLGDFTEVEVGFQYRVVGSDDEFTLSPMQTFSETGTFTQMISGLEQGMTYEFQAVGLGDGGDIGVLGDVLTFEVGSSQLAATGSSMQMYLLFGFLLVGIGGAGFSYTPIRQWAGR